MSRARCRPAAWITGNVTAPTWTCKSSGPTAAFASRNLWGGSPVGAGCTAEIWLNAPAFLAQNLSSETDLLILNRFGRGESEGKGFRDLIGAAIASDVPVLTALRPAYVEAWAAFGAEMACELPVDRSAVLDWFNAVQGTRACA